MNKLPGKELSQPLKRTRPEQRRPAVWQQALRRQVHAAALRSEPGNHLSRCDRVPGYIRELGRIFRSAPQMAITLSVVAYIFDMEKTHSSRIFRSITGKSLCEWKRQIRIDCAKDLLRYTRRSIADICHAIGYSDLRTFERNFQMEAGMCPRSFRQLHRISASSSSGDAAGEPASTVSPYPLPIDRHFNRLDVP